MLEVEVKVKVNREDIAAEIAGLGFECGSSVYEKDSYFNSEFVDLKKQDKALRIRQRRNLSEGDEKYVMNFKGPKVDDTTMAREEIQFEIPSFEAGLTMLTGLGYKFTGIVEKTRTHYRRADITCCLDQVTGLGEFLEIEILSDEAGHDEAVARIEELLSQLGMSLKDTTRHSYLSMLEE